MSDNPRKIVVLQTDEEGEAVALFPSATLHEYRRALVGLNIRAQLANSLLQQWARAGIGADSPRPVLLARQACDIAAAYQEEIEKRGWSVKLPNTQAVMEAYEKLEPSTDSKFGIG